MFLVPVWQMVTVALAPAFFCIRMAIRGFPTRLLRPQMTTCLPSGLFPLRMSNSCTPCGVQGRKYGSPISIRPTFTGWNPSTSFSGSMAFSTLSSSMCLGSGSCTRMPWNLRLPLSSAILARSSFSPAALGIHEGLGVDAQFGAGLALAGDVGDRRGVLADADHDQARRDAFRLEVGLSSPFSSARMSSAILVPLISSAVILDLSPLVQGFRIIASAGERGQFGLGGVYRARLSTEAVAKCTCSKAW